MELLKACCGFGHREVFANITEQLDKAVLEAAEQGCIIFYTGAMGQFDSLFCSAVRKAKRSYPITLYHLRTKNTYLLLFI